MNAASILVGGVIPAEAVAALGSRRRPAQTRWCRLGSSKSVGRPGTWAVRVPFNVRPGPGAIARHAFELVNAVILEADSRLRHQILDRARDKDFAGTRFSADARADVKRETEHLCSAHLVFARVQPHPDL